MYKVKHLLDKSFYAVKEISIDVRSHSERGILKDIDHLLNEVRYLARIKSSYVVDYNYSWIEVKLRVLV